MRVDGSRSDGRALEPPPGLVYRTAQEGDRPFLADLYASTRSEELAPLPWSEAEKRAFLRSQFDAQDRHYRAHFPDCAFLVVEEEGGPAIGRLYVDRREDEVRLVDIALVPERRGRGIGSRILEGVLAEAARAGLPVRIHVERDNPARRLYARLGFRAIGENGVHLLMERLPAEAPGAAPGPANGSPS